MKILMDTTTLIAAMLPDHVHHAASFPRLAQAKTLAELRFGAEKRPLIRPTAEVGHYGAVNNSSQVATSSSRSLK